MCQSITQQFISYTLNSNSNSIFNVYEINCCVIDKCFSTAGSRPGTGPWYQLYRAARGLKKLQYATRFH